MTHDSFSLTVSPTALSPNRLAFGSDAPCIRLFEGNCIEFMDQLIEQAPKGLFDMIFADPPYFLSNGGITCRNGKMVKVDKGDWDKSQGIELNHEFNLAWLSRCQKLLKPNGTIWVSGTQHVIFSVGFAMQQLGMRLLNNITWEKPNPPPNLSRRFFTHATETILWAAKGEKSKHRFHYDAMRNANGGKQMKSIWHVGVPRKEEKAHGRHSTQKPVALLERILLSSTDEGDLVFDPFAGSGTTGIAALRHLRGFVGCDLDQEAVTLSVRRVEGEIARLLKPPRKTARQLKQEAMAAQQSLL